MQPPIETRFLLRSTFAAGGVLLADFWLALSPLPAVVAILLTEILPGTAPAPAASSGGFRLLSCRYDRPARYLGVLLIRLG